MAKKKKKSKPANDPARAKNSPSASVVPPHTEITRPVPVHVETLRLNNFRNYETLELQLDSRHVVLTGENGAGKTNLMEAVSFLSPGRGLRRSTYQDVARAAGDGTWAVNVDLQGNEGPVSIGTGLLIGPSGIEPSRRIRINQAPAKAADELLEHSRVVWLIPAMDGLFTGPAAERRRFLDRMVLAIDPAHGRRVANFEKAMRQRNRLLENTASEDAWLSGIEIQMAELGAAIAAARTELVALLTEMVARGRKQDGPFPDAIIALDGILEAEVITRPAAALEDNYAKMLRDGRSFDRGAGRTLIGPHRSDFLVQHGPNQMDARLCSTGEQKALLVGLVLAHARLTSELTDAAPIILLDEIAAHLDEGRRAALFDLVDTLGCQAWMTGTDASMFEALGERALQFKVANGTVTTAQ